MAEKDAEGTFSFSFLPLVPFLSARLGISEETAFRLLIVGSLLLVLGIRWLLRYRRDAQAAARLLQLRRQALDATAKRLAALEKESKTELDPLPYATAKYNSSLCVAHAVAQPLSSPEQLLGWEKGERERTEGRSLFPQTPLRPFRHCFDPSSRVYNRKNRLIVCHDMMGGYLEDRFVQGSVSSMPFFLSHWELVDIFIYFSHHLVTIPPVAWINVAHKHGTKVLGTFITEHEEGENTCAMLLGTPEAAQKTAEKLVDISAFYGFDGWLINVENKLSPPLYQHFSLFLSTLTKLSHEKVPGSEIIYYDSLSKDGELDWQDRLSPSNLSLFSLVDGIFTNYTWKKEYPASSAALAGPRRYDVYHGIDCFGRGTYGGGGFDTNKALDVILNAGVSVAIFAPGWVYERLSAEERTRSFLTDQCRFWGMIADVWRKKRVFYKRGEALFYSSFDYGWGRGIWREGQLLSSSMLLNAPSTSSPSPYWFNLSAAGVQPSPAYIAGARQTSANGKSMVRAKITQDFSFNGGSSLYFQGVVAPSSPLFFSLFNLDWTFNLSKAFEISYTFCIGMQEDAIGGGDACDLSLALSLETDTPFQEHSLFSRIVLRSPSLVGSECLTTLPKRGKTKSHVTGKTETEIYYEPVCELVHLQGPPPSARSLLTQKYLDRLETENSNGALESQGDQRSGSDRSTLSTSSLKPGMNGVWKTRVYRFDLHNFFNMKLKEVAAVCTVRRRSTIGTGGVAGGSEEKRSTGEPFPYRCFLGQVVLDQVPKAKRLADRPRSITLCSIEAQSAIRWEEAEGETPRRCYLDAILKWKTIIDTSLPLSGGLTTATVGEENIIDQGQEVDSQRKVQDAGGDAETTGTVDWHVDVFVAPASGRENAFPSVHLGRAFAEEYKIHGFDVTALFPSQGAPVDIVLQVGGVCGAVPPVDEEEKERIYRIRLGDVPQEAKMVEDEGQEALGGSSVLRHRPRNTENRKN